MSATDAYTPPPHGWRTFLIIWASQSFSVFGTSITFFATTIWLTETQFPLASQRGDLALALAAVGIAGTFAGIFGAPLAGAWADRHDRKRTMIAMNIGSGIVSLVIGSLIALHLLQIWLLVAITFVDGLFGAFHDMSFTTSYSMIVPDKHLARANGMVQTIFSLASILAPGIAAAIIALPDLARQGALGSAVGSTLATMRDGTPLALFVDAATFFVMALVLVFLLIPSPHRADLQASAGTKRPSYWTDIRSGFTYIWRRRPLLWLLASFTVANLVTSSRGIFNPLIVKYDLVADWSAHGFTFTTALALLSTMAGIGGLIGGVVVSTWGGLKRRRIYGVIIPMLFSSLAQIAFGLSPLLYLSAGLTFVFVAMTPILNAHSQAIWQAQTPRELQGRVFAVRRLIAQGTVPFGTLLAGITGGIFNPGLVMAALGGIYALFCIIQLANPALSKVEDTAYLDAMAARAPALS